MRTHLLHSLLQLLVSIWKVVIRPSCGASFSILGGRDEFASHATTRATHFHNVEQHALLFIFHAVHLLPKPNSHHFSFNNSFLLCRNPSLLFLFLQLLGAIM